MSHRFFLESHWSLPKFVVTAILILVLSPMPADGQVSERENPLQAYFSAETFFCPLDTITVKPDSISGGNPPYSIAWKHGNQLLEVSDSLVWAGTDSTQITIEVTDARQRFIRQDVWLIPYEAVQAGFTSNVNDGCLPLDVVFFSDYLQFQFVKSMSWEFGNGQNEVSMASVAHTFTEEGVYFPTLTIEDNHGCKWKDTMDVALRVYPTPAASFETQENRIYLPERTVQVVNTSEGASNYLWIIDGWGHSTEEAPEIDLPGIEDTYRIKLRAINTFGCVDEYIRNIDLVQAIALFVPNAFTPDGDGINDEWQPKGQGIDAFYMTVEVRDSWGTLVFRGDNPDANWDGRSIQSGIFVAPGTYNYRIIARDTERGIGHEFKGHLMVLR